ncbi:MAG: Glucose--fructose oxidoreductase precursor [Candidatus Hydrogenedentes bacterium ADurb.Bin101]|nr:MAG: Glucose--fructose oxidoreductase precursor [Candidatus Hydrogenedentes bacterium ADurb.Bin101]
MDDIRIGIIGLGGICRARHVPGFRKIEGVRLCAVANRTRASSERAAREAGIPEVCGSWQELVARDDINTVVIGAWPYLHCEASVAALEAGKHVFCQARMARNQEEAERMAAAARKSGRVAGLCPVPYGLSIDRLMARLLRENTLGPVRYVTVSSFSDAWRDRNAPITWRKDQYLSGLNVQTLGMFIEVIHRWFGWTTRVSAETFLFTNERPDVQGNMTPVRVPDQVIAATVVGGNIPVHYVISGVSGFTGDAIGIYGEKCALQYDVDHDILYRCVNGAMEPLEPEDDERYDVANWRVEQEFVDAIREGAPYHPDFEDGLQYMKVIQAIHDAAATGKTVHVEA